MSARRGTALPMLPAGFRTCRPCSTPAGGFPESHSPENRVPVVKHRPLDGVQLDAAYREGKVPVIQLVYDGTVPPHIEIPVQDGFRLSAENRGIDPEIVRVECGGVFHLRDLFQLPCHRQQGVEVRKRFLMDIHIAVTHDGQQPVDVVVLPADGRLCPLIVLEA